MSCKKVKTSAVARRGILSWGRIKRFNTVDCSGSSGGNEFAPSVLNEYPKDDAARARRAQIEGIQYVARELTFSFNYEQVQNILVSLEKIEPYPRFPSQR